MTWSVSPRNPTKIMGSCLCRRRVPHGAGARLAARGRPSASSQRSASVERPQAASDVVPSARECRVARTAARLVTPSAACDVPETRAAAAACRCRGAHVARRPAAAAGPRAGRGCRRSRVRAGRPRRPTTAPRRAARLSLRRPARPHRAASSPALLRAAVLQPLPLEQALQARYVRGQRPRATSASSKHAARIPQQCAVPLVLCSK